MPVITARRPGITFESRPPRIVSPLPRMDVAGFVGFAPSGPVNLPVPVEDVARFHDIFGTDLPLARDTETDAIVYAELPPAVRAFFRNGGARCWVVRVAGAAVTNRFAIPALLNATPGRDIRAAIAMARSPGSWSDSLLANATLLRRPLAVNAVSPPADGPFRARGLRAGELIQIEFPAVPELVAFQRVPVPDPDSELPPDAADLPMAKAHWFRRATSADVGVSSPPHDITWLPSPLGVRWMSEIHPQPDPALPLIGWGVRDDDFFVLEFSREDARGVQPGSWVSVDTTSAPVNAQPRLLMLIDSIEGASGVSSPPTAEAVRATARAWWTLDPNAAAAAAAGLDVRAAVVEFEMRVQDPSRPDWRLGDLGFAAPHPSYWGDIPDDEVAFREEDERPGRRDRIAPQLLERVMNPRFPLAPPVRPLADLADAERAPLFIPLGMPGVTRPEFAQAALPRPGDALTRDGLNTFNASLFLDRELANTPSTSLMANAFYVQYIGAPSGLDRRAGRALTGLHALTPIDEVSMIAVPDALQRPWEYAPSVISPLGAPTLTEATPVDCDVTVRWTPVAGAASYTLQVSFDPRFVTVARSWTVNATEQTHAADFVPNCGARLFYRVRAVSSSQGSGPWSNTLSATVPPMSFDFCAATELAAPAPIAIAEERGRVVVSWNLPPQPDVVFTLERASDPEFASGAVVYTGSAQSYEALRGAEPVVYFRVAAEAGGVRSAWSVTAMAGEIASEAYVLTDALSYDDRPLFQVQRDLIRWCAARADAHAVLGLPEHFREDVAAEYIDRLSTSLEITDATRVLSYAAVFHPWIVVRETTGRPDLATWSVPPDGAVCGTIAARTLRNGVWYSPANQLLVGALALSPDLEDVAVQLLAARVNPIVQQPQGFVAMDAVTLHPGDEFGELHVRRLLILLRRLALREGAAYVFRNNDDALRRLVERQFEQVLGDLFVRGAFAGQRHEEGYIVVADETVNTPPGRDAGRFVVELRVAPSHPLMFLTVRLVQEGGAWQATEEP